MGGEGGPCGDSSFLMKVLVLLIMQHETNFNNSPGGGAG